MRKMFCILLISDICCFTEYDFTASLLSVLRADFTAIVADYAHYGIDFVADCIEDDNDGINAHS